MLLVNLALALGLVSGYAWWGREAEPLRQELARTRAASLAGGEREFHAQGVVRAILPELNVLVVTHDDIAGYMPPMTMGFRVATPAAARRRRGRRFRPLRPARHGAESLRHRDPEAPVTSARAR